ncbi:hypothetical protein OG21DRAFT_1570567 [Imleria badia]|nr:hypothetical protein OG21DRAFT_1570567 [Imleria badia]
MAPSHTQYAPAPTDSLIAPPSRERSSLALTVLRAEKPSGLLPKPLNILTPVGYMPTNHMVSIRLYDMDPSEVDLMAQARSGIWIRRVHFVVVVIFLAFWMLLVAVYAVRFYCTACLAHLELLQNTILNGSPRAESCWSPVVGTQISPPAGSESLNTVHWSKTFRVGVTRRRTVASWYGSWIYVPVRQKSTLNDILGFGYHTGPVWRVV